MKPTAYQRRVLQTPEDFDLFLGGGRGGGKSYALLFLALRHVEQNGPRARVLYLRATYQGLVDFELACRELFAAAYGSGATYNGSAHLWRFPAGGTLELGQLESPNDYPKYQGRSFSLLLVDELGQFSDPALIEMVRSNLRGPKDLPLRTVYAANPGGPGHAWISSRYALCGSPWRPCLDTRTQRQFVSCPSTYRDNPEIDREAYHGSLVAACASDPELLRAWADGDWAIARGAFFASVLSEERNAVDDLPPQRWAGHIDHWHTYLAHDFGSSAPSVTYIVLRSAGGRGPDDRYYPNGSLILLDELATNDPSSLNRGLGWTVPQLAEAVRDDLCRRWSVAARGVADDAIFARTGSGAGSIAEEFNRERVYFQPARKSDRITGWARMRRMLADAGKPDRPGLYVSRCCVYWWQTVPVLPRDPRRVEDVDSRAFDHGADATRYSLGREFRGGERRTWGLY